LSLRLSKNTPADRQTDTQTDLAHYHRKLYSLRGFDTFGVTAFQKSVNRKRAKSFAVAIKNTPNMTF
jgi:hypothetical protein